MSGIFGLVDPGCVGDRDLALKRMTRVMLPWGRLSVRTAALDVAAFGQAVTVDTPESRFEDLPRCAPASGLLFTAEARLDNRDEVADLLEVPRAGLPGISDGELLFRAYGRWGDQCPRYLLGDWSFAAWNTLDRSLLLARDQTGNTGVWFAKVGDRVAFASDITAVLQAAWVPRELDEVYLARMLACNAAGLDDATAYRQIRRVLPGHVVRISSDGVRVSQYWSADGRPETRFSTDDEYAEALRETIRVAVKCRLRSERAVGSSLSSGLDSGMVTALAADELSRSGDRLTALTAVPDAEGLPPLLRHAILDEGPGAAALVQQHPAIEHLLCRSDVSPIAGLRESQALFHVPCAGRNGYWILSMLRASRERGLGVFLTGQSGNFTFSWPGSAPGVFSLIAAGRYRRAVSESLPRWVTILRQRGWNPVRLAEPPWRDFSALHHDVAKDLHVEDRIRQAGRDPWLLRAVDSRSALLFSGAATAGPIWARVGAAFGLAVRDPLQDVRVVELSFSMPDRLWSRPPARWLARAAAAGLLPDTTRFNPRRGLQAADLCHRLAGAREELDACFEEVEASPLARRFVDLPHCRAAAHQLMRCDWQAILGAGADLLMRGLETALFLARVDRGEPRLLTVA